MSAATPATHTPDEARAVQLWARGQVDAWEGTPREVVGDDGRVVGNAARGPAGRAAASATRTVAAVLGVPPAQVGPCAGCHVPHHRYGDGGGPLCRACREGREGVRAGVRAPAVTLAGGRGGALAVTR